VIVVETNHSLSGSEIALLQSLMGQSIAFIHAAKADGSGKPYGFDFDDAVTLQVNKGVYVAISGEFDETQFGDDFIRIKIEQRETPLSTNHAPMGRLTEPFFCLAINPPFTISAIEVYGYSYQIRSKNDKVAPYWQIEKDHPGQAVAEQIETENILLFCAKDNRRLMVHPHGAVPWMRVTLEDDLIEKLLVRRNLEGEIVTKLKMRLL
jgi:hypothetical protein